jgi:hypothetical protein
MWTAVALVAACRRRRGGFPPASARIEFARARNRTAGDLERVAKLRRAARKTIEKRLGEAYRKLGIGSRIELPAALCLSRRDRARDAVPDGPGGNAR